MQCFVCGKEVALYRPFNTPVYGDIENIAHIGVCEECWKKNWTRAEIKKVKKEKVEER